MYDLYRSETWVAALVYEKYICYRLLSDFNNLSIYVLIISILTWSLTAMFLSFFVGNISSPQLNNVLAFLIFLKIWASDFKGSHTLFNSDFNSFQKYN